MGLNVVNLVGRVGGDPDVRYFESGNVKCRLTLAVNRPTKNRETDWFNLDLWGKTAEIAQNYVRKGSLIGVEGSLKIDHWVDRTTNAQRTVPVIVVRELRLLGSKGDNEGGGGYSGGGGGYSGGGGDSGYNSEF